MDRFDREERAGGGGGGFKNRTNVRLPPEVNRILYVRQLPYKISAEELYEIFGKFGSIRQIRQGTSFQHNSRGRAFVVYDDIYQAKDACEQLSGFAVQGRYISVTYHRADKLAEFKTGGSLKEQNAEKGKALEKLEKNLGVKASS